jgi:spore germination cell wall hydrolase CwlJ-like protein
MIKKLLIISSAIVSMSSFANADFNDEVRCMAENMYWESRNQTFHGLIAVGQVVMNRVEDSRFPNTICEVIHQGPTKRSWKNPLVSYPVRDRCQFSWYCDGKSDDIPEYDFEMYEFIRSLALKVSQNYFKDMTDGATHYHAYYVTPEWASSKTHTIKIDDHIFYRWEK